MEVADDAWASLLPDLLLDIFRRLETTAIIRCAAACKPWRRAIIGNASSFRPRPDCFNPNLHVGFFHHIWNERVLQGRWSPPRVTVSVTAVDTGHWESLSSLIPATSAGCFDLSSSHRHGILSSRDGFLLLQLRRGSKHDELCLCNPMAQNCTFLPLAPIKDCKQYTIITGHDDGGVRILAKAETHVLCTEEDRLSYQVFSCGGGGGGGDGAGIWGPLQSSDVLDKGLRMQTHGRNALVARDAVHWLAGPQLSGCRVTCTVGLDIYTGRAWVTELPSQCQFFHTSTTPYALTTSVNGRLSLLQPLPDHHIIQVWVLDGDGDAMEWTVQHRISIDVQNQPGDAMLMSHYSNVVCPRSGFLFIMLFSSLQLRINRDSHARNPVQCIGKRDRYDYYPYEMDWSTYISNMKIF